MRRNLDRIRHLGSWFLCDFPPPDLSDVTDQYSESNNVMMRVVSLLLASPGSPLTLHSL